MALNPVYPAHYVVYDSVHQVPSMHLYLYPCMLIFGVVVELLITAQIPTHLCITVL